MVADRKKRGSLPAVWLGPLLLSAGCRAFLPSSLRQPASRAVSPRLPESACLRRTVRPLPASETAAPSPERGSAKAPEKKKKKPLHPKVGDFVRYNELDGGREDGEVLIGKITFIQKNIGSEGSGWLLELSEMEDVGDGYYADYSARKRGSKKSLRDLASVSPVSASFVRGEGAYRVPVSRDTGLPSVRAERYDIDGYRGPFSEPGAIDQSVVEQDAVLYGELKGRLFRYVAAAGFAGTLIADLSQGIEDAAIYAAGVAASLLYLFFLSIKTDTIASRESKMGSNVANLRFGTPALVLVGVALYNASLGDANPVGNAGPFDTITTEQFAAAVLGFLTYRLPLFFIQIQDSLKDGGGDVTLPGSAGVAMQLAREAGGDDESPVAGGLTDSDLTTVLLVSGPQAAGRPDLVRRLIEEGGGRFVEPDRVDRAKDGETFERCERRGEFLAVDPTNRYGMTRGGILDAAGRCGSDSVVVIDADVALAKKMRDVPGLRLVGVWVGLGSVSDFEAGVAGLIDAGAIPIPEDETRESVTRGKIREIVQEIEFGITSGVFEFTILNEDEDESLKELREAGSYCFK